MPVKDVSIVDLFTKK